jgi:hypothetical protein
MAFPKKKVQASKAVHNVILSHLQNTDNLQFQDLGG